MTRTEYRNKLETSLQTMETRISDLEAKINEAGAGGKTAFQRLLDEVKSKRDVVRTRLTRAGDATDSAWNELKRGLDGAWGELEKSYERARSELVSAS